MRELGEGQFGKVLLMKAQVTIHCIICIAIKCGVTHAELYIYSHQCCDTHNWVESVLFTVV